MPTRECMERRWPARGLGDPPCPHWPRGGPASRAAQGRSVRSHPLLGTSHLFGHCSAVSTKAERVPPGKAPGAPRAPEGVHSPAPGPTEAAQRS